MAVIFFYCQILTVLGVNFDAVFAKPKIIEIMGTIDVINYFLGGLFILLGFLTSINPNLIAGYNTAPKDEKESFDINGFKHLLKKTIVVR